jgi:hypothetical protein
MFYFPGNQADKPDEMTPIPRCNWRASVVLIAAITAAIVTSSQAADVKPTRAMKPAATTRATTTRQSTADTTTTPAPNASSAPIASAPSTASNPDDRSDWSATMNTLGTLLAGHDLPALQKMLRPSPIIRPFASDALQTHERLLGATTGSTLLGVHAYDSKTPSTLASDLSNDFNSAGDTVPQGVREGMVPPDEATARRANETAGQWLMQVLQPDKHEVTGVIVLWPNTRNRPLGAEPRRAIFVLVKGEKVDDKYVFRQITFGDPLESPQ